MLVKLQGKQMQNFRVASKERIHKEGKFITYFFMTLGIGNKNLYSPFELYHCPNFEPFPFQFRNLISDPLIADSFLETLNMY